MAVVVFDPIEFVDRYPRFAGVLTPGQLKNLFAIACNRVDNTKASIVPYDPDNGEITRETVIYVLMCHIATMELWPAGQSGPIASAAEGSVNVSFAIPQSANNQWYMKTPCGETFLELMKPYVVGPRYYSYKHHHPWG